MNRFKKALRKQLIILPILAVLGIITGSIIYEVRKSAYQEISQKEFKRIALENEITNYSRLGNRLEMETPDGKKYYHNFNSSIDRYEFGQMILDKFSSYGWSDRIPFYELGIPIIISILLGIIFFNLVVVLWFVTLFDLLKSEFEENHNKWIWLICLFFVPLITPSFYLLIAENQKRKSPVPGFPI